MLYRSGRQDQQASIIICNAVDRRLEEFASKQDLLACIRHKVCIYKTSIERSYVQMQITVVISSAGCPKSYVVPVKQSSDLPSLHSICVKPAGCAYQLACNDCPQNEMVFDGPRYGAAIMHMTVWAFQIMMHVMVSLVR